MEEIGGWTYKKDLGGVFLKKILQSASQMKKSSSWILYYKNKNELGTRTNYENKESRNLCKDIYIFIKRLRDYIYSLFSHAPCTLFSKV